MNIKFADGANLVVYSMTLEQALKDITPKIGDSAYGITWIIFNEANLAQKNQNGYFKINIPSFLPLQNYKYGFCYADKKEIWISTAAIQSYKLNSFMLPSSLLTTKKNDILLVNVILDEIAHIKTGKDHGNDEYDNLLQKYYHLYYK